MDPPPLVRDGRSRAFSNQASAGNRPREVDSGEEGGLNFLSAFHLMTSLASHCEPSGLVSLIRSV